MPCPACNSNQYEDARLISTGVQPVRTRTLAKLQAPAEISARVCLDCGHIGDLKADTARLRELVGA